MLGNTSQETNLKEKLQATRSVEAALAIERKIQDSGTSETLSGQKETADESEVEAEDTASVRSVLPNVLKATVDYDGVVKDILIPNNITYEALVIHIDSMLLKERRSPNTLKRKSLRLAFCRNSMLLANVDSNWDVQYFILRWSEFSEEEKSEGIQLLCYKSTSKPLKVVVEGPVLIRPGWVQFWIPPDSNYQHLLDRFIAKKVYWQKWVLIGTSYCLVFRTNLNWEEGVALESDKHLKEAFSRAKEHPEFFEIFLAHVPRNHRAVKGRKWVVALNIRPRFDAGRTWRIGIAVVNASNRLRQSRLRQGELVIPGVLLENSSQRAEGQQPLTSAQAMHRFQDISDQLSLTSQATWGTRRRSVGSEKEDAELDSKKNVPGLKLSKMLTSLFAGGANPAAGSIRRENSVYSLKEETATYTVIHKRFLNDESASLRINSDAGCLELAFGSRHIAVAWIDILYLAVSPQDRYQIKASCINQWSRYFNTCSQDSTLNYSGWITTTQYIMLHHTLSNSDPTL